MPELVIIGALVLIIIMGLAWIVSWYARWARTRP